MKFIDSEGNVSEGEPLSPQQFERMEEIRELLHQKICGNAFHSQWDRKHGLVNCDKVAIYLVRKFELQPKAGVNVQHEIDQAERENAPDEAPMPISDVTAATASVKDDDIPW